MAKNILSYKLSPFTIVHDLTSRSMPDNVLIFSTRSRKSVIIAKHDWKLLNDACCADHQSVQADILQSFEKCVELGFFDESSVNSFSSWLNDFDSIRNERDTIFPLLTVTTACNIACGYCYEHGVDYKTMTDDIIDSTLGWMELRVVQDGISTISPGLFGGEPLLFPKKLFRIMDGFLKLQEKYDIKGEFYSSSNGMLLTDSLAKILAEKGLTQIQISIDGSKAMHDSRRPMKSGKSSFDKVMEGLGHAISHIKSVTVKINFDRQNLQDALHVLDTLKVRGWDKIVTVKLETIAKQFPDSKVSHDSRLVIPIDSMELADSYSYLWKACRDRGIRVTDDTAHTTPCMFSSAHGVIIGPDGLIYKCISLVGREEFAVGSVTRRDYDTEKYESQMSVSSRMHDCFEEKCEYMPVCAGGCAYEAAVETGTYKERSCTKNFLKRFHYIRNLEKHSALIENIGGQGVSESELSATFAKALDSSFQVIRFYDKRSLP